MAKLARTRYDVAIIGAGPVGLALAVELAKHDFATLVVDRRPPPDEDAHLRPQLLVARAGDLAHLAHLGLDTEDTQLVSPLASRCEGDLTTGRFARGFVRAADVDVPKIRPTDLWTLAAQPPLALVPIGRLQRALLDEARRVGVEVVYDFDVARLRRHARDVSLASPDGASATAAMAIIATGAARALIAATKCNVGVETPPKRMIGGVFAASGPMARWVRLEVPLAGHPAYGVANDTATARVTVLETTPETGAGTAVLVDVPAAADVPEHVAEELLHRGFEAAARAHGLAGERFVSTPAVFATSVASVSHRFIGGDGRAPVAIAGDAAQTGHVFTGQTCFVNIALALGLADQLRNAKGTFLPALAKYERSSQIGAAILAQRSVRHLMPHPTGAWALAGVA